MTLRWHSLELRQQLKASACTGKRNLSAVPKLMVS